MFAFQTYRGEEITDAMLGQAAGLFSSSYGVWGPLAERELGTWATKGRRVKMNANRLKSQILPGSGDNVYVRAETEGEYVGHVFATRWSYEGKKICWITQLCVKHRFRRKGLATNLITKLKEGKNDAGFGILSSHPAAIMAALRVYGNGLEGVDLGAIKRNAHGIMAMSPVDYVRGALLAGSLFEEDDEGVKGRVDGNENKGICCAFTSFYVDHGEPIAVLEEVKKSRQWPFGELPEGCEYLALGLEDVGVDRGLPEFSVMMFWAIATKSKIKDNTNDAL